MIELIPVLNVSLETVSVILKLHMMLHLSEIHSADGLVNSVMDLYIQFT